MYCDSSVPQRSRMIVRSWSGYGTGDTVYETADGRRLVTAGTATCPEGYFWDPRISDSNSTSVTLYPTFVVAEEPPPKRAKYTDPAPRPTLCAPKVRPDFRAVQRPEFHARSNPR